MRRFTRNRWWTFVLALALGLACAIGLPGGARATTSTGTTGGTDGTGSGTPPPTGTGDPDFPQQGPKSVKPGVMQGGMAGTRTFAVGDGFARVPGTSVWVMRVRLVAQQLLRNWYFRF